jgi:signal transduction histidine kinase
VSSFNFFAAFRLGERFRDRSLTSPQKMNRNSTVFPSSSSFSLSLQRKSQESNSNIVSDHSPLPRSRVTSATPDSDPLDKLKHSSHRHFQSDLQIHSRICLFRFLLAISLLASGTLSATLSYLFITDYEDQLYTEEFRSVVDNIYKSVDDGIHKKVDTMVHFSSLMGYLCPHSNNWPNCSIPSSTFTTLTASLIDAGNSRSIGTAPLVRLDQKEAYEKFAYEFFESDGGFPIGTGISSFGKGIYQKVNEQRVPDLTGNTNFSTYSNIFFPILQVSDIPNNYPGIMYNMHSEQSRVEALDASMNCSAVIGSKNLGHCTSITDVIQLVSDKKPSPASVMYTPVFPAHHNNSMVGAATLIFNWVDLLTFDLPFDSSIYCILETKTVKHVFLLESQSAVYVGEDSAFDLSDHIDHHLHTTRTVIQEADLLTTTEYNLRFIPHEKFYEQYHSTLPIIACVTCLLIVSTISVIFLLFDFFSKREVAKNVALLDSKRIFVRFISHEIRSPLNTIVLGLEVLREKVIQLQQKKCILASASASNGAPVGEGGGGRGGVVEERERESDGRITNTSASRTFHLHPLPNIVELLSDISPSHSNSSSLKSPPQTTTGSNSQMGSEREEKEEEGDSGGDMKCEEEYVECLEIIQELNENSEAAVVVLNDLINYDKIELKTFTIEKKEINFGKLLEKTCNSLLSQAKQKNIELTFHLDHQQQQSLPSLKPPPADALTVSTSFPPPPRSASASLDQFSPSQSKVTSSEAVVALAGGGVGVGGATTGGGGGEFLQSYLINGDAIKLGQVFRNVISNALKLTPSGGKVSVQGTPLPPLLFVFLTHPSLCLSSGVVYCLEH